MPSLNDIETKRKREFKKRDYRPWDIDGNNSSNIKQNSEKNSNVEAISYENIELVRPELFKNWEFHDRPESELGDIDSPAKEFNDIGQQQPCIVRSINVDEYNYELIVGERRWHAAKLAKTDLKVIVKNISDSDAALIQASENLNRQGLSDYARGISYYNLVEKGIITQADLVDKLHISKQQISRLLSFSKIPDQIVTAIGDMSKISSRTAEHIKQLSNKGDMYVNYIIKVADKLREGKLGHEKLTALVEGQAKNNISAFDSLYSKNEKVFIKNGRPIFVWRFNKKAKVSIDFSSDIAELLYLNKIDHNLLTTLLKEFMEKNLIEIK